MVLNREEIHTAGIVAGAVPTSCRPTTYDATIGDIIFRGELWDKDTFVLPKRGIVWVVSAEEFSFPDTKTGLATLKTTWTHKGVLALNVGVVDPGWKGPLATAMVNLGSDPVPLNKGEAFFRVMTFRHKRTTCEKVVKPRDVYLREIQEKSTNFAPTFLDTESLVEDVAEQVFRFPKIGVIVGWAGLGIAVGSLFLAILAIFAPMAVNVFADHRSEAVEHRRLEQRIDELEKDAEANTAREAGGAGGPTANGVTEALQPPGNEAANAAANRT